MFYRPFTGQPYRRLFPNRDFPKKNTITSNINNLKLKDNKNIIPLKTSTYKKNRIKNRHNDKPKQRQAVSGQHHGCVINYLLIIVHHH